MSDGFLNTTTTVATELVLVRWHSASVVGIKSLEAQ
jgi:hypothetical protein